MKHLHNRFHHILLVYLLFILVFPASPAAAKSPVTFESLYSFESVGDVQLSPGGSRLTFVSRRSVVETNSSLSTVWLMDVSGKMMKKISPGGKSAWHPRWVDQGKRIAFLTVTDQGAQVFTCEIDTGKIEQNVSVSVEHLHALDPDAGVTTEIAKDIRSSMQLSSPQTRKMITPAGECATANLDAVGRGQAT